MENRPDANAFVFKMPEQFGCSVLSQTLSDLQKVIAGEWKSLVLDLSDTVMMDSSGVGSLVFVYQELKARSKTLLLRNLQRNIYDLLVETGIDKLFDVEKPSGIRKAEVDLLQLDIPLDVTEEIVGDICILNLSGVMSYPAGSMQFKRCVFLSLAKSRKILLDFENLAFFDSLSVGSVLRLSRLMRENGGSLKVCSANLVIKNMFSSLGIDSIIPIYHSREEALARWEGRS
ncbi:MAG: STAS domain-containing protein [Chitinispirillaceae bacterium]